MGVLQQHELQVSSIEEVKWQLTESSMHHLSEQTQFPVFTFYQVVQKH